METMDLCSLKRSNLISFKSPVTASSPSVISLRLGNRCLGYCVCMHVKWSTQVQGQSQTIMIYHGSGRVSYELVIVYLRVTRYCFKCMGWK